MLQSEGIESKQAIEDADYDMMKTALNRIPSCESVVILEEDEKVLVLLNSLESEVKNVFFQNRGRAECVTLYKFRELHSIGVILEVPPGTFSLEATPPLRFSSIEKQTEECDAITPTFHPCH